MSHNGEARNLFQFEEELNARNEMQDDFEFTPEIREREAALRQAVVDNYLTQHPELAAKIADLYGDIPVVAHDSREIIVTPLGGPRHHFSVYAGMGEGTHIFDFAFERRGGVYELVASNIAPELESAFPGASTDR